MILLYCLFFSITNDLTELRDLFIRAPSDKVSCQTLLLKAKSADSGSTVKLGYQGASYIIMAKHHVSPWAKWKDFRKGRDLLEEAIQLSPTQPELRFLRLAIQSNLPALLNYNSSLRNDHAFLKRKLPDIRDKDLQKRVAELLKMPR